MVRYLLLNELNFFINNSKIFYDDQADQASDNDQSLSAAWLWVISCSVVSMFICIFFYGKDYQSSRIDVDHEPDGFDRVSLSL